MTEILTGQLKKTTERSNINCIMIIAGADPGGGGWVRAPSKIGKNMICWRKIVIFHTKYPKNFKVRPP